MKWLAIAVSLCATTVCAEEIGSVSTTFRFIGANDRIVVERFDDPAVENASCYVSYAAAGGIAGSLGLATDPNRFSIACRATGPIRIVGSVSDRFEEVFNRNSSILFRQMRVSRMLDSARNTLVYLVWSTELIDGSPFNSVTAISIE
jgi:CreA protein